MARTLLALLLSVALASGCVQDAPAAKASASPTFAAEPTVAASLGSLHGVVTDEESQPIAGAEVALVGTPILTKTDEAGAFTINDLEPAEYGVTVHKIGYVQAGRKVTVVAGEVAQMNIQLAAFEIAPEPYVVVVPRRALIEFGQVFLDNRYPPGVYPCKACDSYFPITPTLMGLQLDQTFRNGISIPDDDIWIDFRINWGNASTSNSQSDGQSLGSGYLKDKVPFTMAESNVKTLAKVEKLWYHLASGVRPSINRQVDSYVSFAHNGPLPEGYSALPPN